MVDSSADDDSDEELSMDNDVEQNVLDDEINPMYNDRSRKKWWSEDDRMEDLTEVVNEHLDEDLWSDLADWAVTSHQTQVNQWPAPNPTETWPSWTTWFTNTSLHCKSRWMAGKIIYYGLETGIRHILQCTASIQKHCCLHEYWW